MTDEEYKNKPLISDQPVSEQKPKLRYLEDELIKNYKKKETIKINKDFKTSKINFINEINNNKITIEKKRENDINENYMYNLKLNIEKGIDFLNKKDEFKLLKENISSRNKITKNDESIMNKNINFTDKISNDKLNYNEVSEIKITKEEAKHRKKESLLINLFINKNLSKYNTNKEDYENILIEQIIMNRNIHIVSVLKDYMIYDYKDEFLKRYYTTQESYVRLPIFSNYYQNYLKFFCIPVFREINLNKIAQNHGDNKAELYYVNNYGRRDLTENNVNNMNINNDENCSVHYEILKMRNILTTTIREKIEETVITKNDGIEENSILLGSWVDLKVNENGLGIFINKLSNKFRNTDSVNEKDPEINVTNKPHSEEKQRVIGKFRNFFLILFNFCFKKFIDLF